MALREWWDKGRYENYSTQDIANKFLRNGFKYWILDLWELDTKRILKIEELRGKKYRILITERLVDALNLSKQTQYRKYENTGDEVWLGEPHNQTEEDLKRWEPAQIIPDYAGVLP